MRRNLLGLLALALTACTPVLSAADHRAAQLAVLPVIERTIGAGPHAGLAASCIVQNATRAEIADLAANEGRGTPPAVVRTVLLIAQRPPAVTCLQQAAT